MSPGTAVIKHYQIVSCLGQGGFGKVFEAWDSKLQRSVAIKCLNADGLLSPAADLTREARMAASLNHPAFVKIHALEDDDNSLAIVMELIKGETLKKVIVNNQLDPEQSIKIIRQIAEAMHQAHDLGLTHGDLKPSNIMLEPSGAIRILDFGLASKADTQATTSMLQQDPQGTIAYMAPERLLGAPLAPQVDIYALGVIFYELLNSQRPFAELNGLALAAALVQSSSDQWNYSRALSPTLIHLVRRMTAKQPAQRLLSMTEFLVALDNVEKEIPFNGMDELDKRIPVNESIEPSQQLNKKQLRKKHFKNAVLLSVLIISCVVLGGWLTRNYLWHFEDVIPRYSESQEMKLGMDALEQWDRPGSLDAAIKHFNNLAEQNPENAAAIAGLSIAYSLKYQGDTQDDLWLRKSAAAAQRANELDPQLSLGLVAEGHKLFNQGHIRKALDMYERVLKLDVENHFGLYGKIECLFRLRRTDEAIKNALENSKLHPDKRAYQDLLGMAYLALGNYSKAERAFSKSIEIQPDSVYAYANLSVALQRQAKTNEAINILQQGLQIRSSSWLYNNLANIYFFRGDYLEAVNAFEAALSPRLGNANDYLAWANLADAQLWVPGKKREAIKNYNRAVELLSPLLLKHPGDTKLHSRMALYVARLGNREASKKILEQIMIEDTSDLDAHFRIGLAYELIGERSLALKEIRTARKLGYPLGNIEAEPDLESLRRDPHYDLR